MKNRLVLPAFTVSLAVIACFLFAACTFALEPVNAGFLPDITEYELGTFVPAPETGESPKFSINAGFYAIQVAWLDKEDNERELGKDEKFAQGRIYQANLTITAHHAFSYLPNPATRFTWEYTKDRIKETENQNDRTVFLNIEFDRTGKMKISNVDLLGIRAPQIEANPVLSLELNVDAPYTAGAVTWSNDDGASFNFNGPFEEDKIYRAQVTLNAKEEYTFNGLKPGVIIHSGRSVTIDPAVPNEDTTAIAITIVFFPAGIEGINQVDLRGIPSPVAGKAPGSAFTAPPAGANYTVSPVIWLEKDKSVSGNFRVNGNYDAQVTISPLSGYMFGELEESRIIHNGRTVSITPVKNGDVETGAYLVTVHYNTLKADITEVDLRGIPAPRTGVIARTNLDTSNFPFRVKSIVWNPLPPNGKFAGNTGYKAAVELEAEAGYTFRGLTVWGVPDNGNDRDISPNPVPDNAVSVTVTITFDKTSASNSGDGTSGDTDGDGFPDNWENQYGYDPNNRNDPDPDGDSDGDGLNNLKEYEKGTNPENPDTDGDGFPDGWEVDNGHDPLDPNDPGRNGDEDGDDFPNGWEVDNGYDPLNPANPDSDGDGFPDDWENQYGYDPNNRNDPDPNGDSDSDSLNNLKEYEKGTDPKNPDTDGDGFPDGWEVNTSYDPLNPNDPARKGDKDGDGFPNGWEADNGHDPLNPNDPARNGDEDGDGFPNGWEADNGHDPLNPNDPGRNGDEDGDGFPNGWEADNGHDPLNPNDPARNGDEDGDGFPNGWEADNGHNPLDPNDPNPNGDEDGDGLANGKEREKGTDPTKSDTDGDGYSDGDEVNAGTDPLDPGKYPAGGGGGNPVETTITLVDLTNLFDRPATGENPDTAIETAQYTGSITWNHVGAFAPDTAYTAVLTLLRKTGYSFIGVSGFSYSGAAKVTASNNTGSTITVIVEFPKTERLPAIAAIADTAQYGDVIIDGITWRVLNRTTKNGQRYALLLGPNNYHIGTKLEKLGQYTAPNQVKQLIDSQYKSLNAPTIKANVVIPNIGDLKSLDVCSSPTNQLASTEPDRIPAFALSYAEANTYRTAWRAAMGVNTPYGIALRTNVEASEGGNYSSAIYYAWPNTGTIKVQQPGSLNVSMYIYVRLALWVKY
ncbi:MAG: hypothetical protein LBB83_08145 [Treponema sp.]|nr:hypothetical protein [Treponema sp.]